MTLFPEFRHHDVREFRKGSTRIALEVEPPFHQYLFIERSKRRAAALQGLRDAFPAKADRIQIVVEDANSYLQRWCGEGDWRRNRVVVFLDPYGMQVEFVNSMSDLFHEEVPLTFIRRVLLILSEKVPVSLRKGTTP